MSIKGQWHRPLAPHISEKDMQKNWDAVFKKKEKKRANQPNDNLTNSKSDR